MHERPLITVAVPSFNQGQYLNKALNSLFSQNLPIEVFVLDGGSTDNSLEVIKQWQTKLAGWRSYSDEGQSAAINEGIALGSAPYVCWLNSDDWLLPNSLFCLSQALKKYKQVGAVYGKSYNFCERKKTLQPVWVEPFSSKRLALRCIISQPATLIRRESWNAVGGLDESLHMAMDYDLWWRLFIAFGPLQYIDEYVAVNREHAATKTKNNRRLHYKEAMHAVKKYTGSVPLKWWFAFPYRVWLQLLISLLRRLTVLRKQPV